MEYEEAAKDSEAESGLDSGADEDEQEEVEKANRNKDDGQSEYASADDEL